MMGKEKIIEWALAHPLAVCGVSTVASGMSIGYLLGGLEGILEGVVIGLFVLMYAILTTPISPEYTRHQ